MGLLNNVGTSGDPEQYDATRPCQVVAQGFQQIDVTHISPRGEALGLGATCVD